jgi:peptide/nickel transport system substrate-binding protein
MSLRYIIRLIQAFFKRFKAIIVIGVVIGAVLFLVISYLIPSLDSTNQRIGIVGRYTTDSIPEEISAKLSAGLTQIDVSGNANPALAKSWESPDGGKTWIFNLNENAMWSDGKKVTAKDIDYKFSDATSEIISDNAIKFNLNSQFSAFPVIVSKPIFKKGLVGSGEWRVKSISLAGGYLQKLVITDKKGDKITYKFYPSDARLTLAFKLGEIDIMNKVQEVGNFSSWKNIKIDKEVGYNNFVAIFLNTEDEGLADKAVRQNLNYATDKNGFEGERALGPLSPESWAYNPQVKQYSRDLEKAKDLKGTTIVLSTLPNLLKVAEKIKKDWEEVGITCEIQVVSDVPDSYQAFLATVDIPKDPDQYSLWHSTQSETNISRFKNARIDKLLEDGRTELDKETRKKVYLDFQRFLVEDVPAIFLYHPTFYTITRK